MAQEEGDEKPIVCGNADCRVAETGGCVEGFDLDACPYYGRQPEEAAAGLEASTAETVALRAADTLDLEDASTVLGSMDARVIAVLGPSDSGKTSLIASLYDLFQDGSVAGVEFARSLTLHAFEHTCHDARAASRRGVPHTNRTPIGEVSFYHIEVGVGAVSPRLALLLGDRSGEEYRSAADDVSVTANFAEVTRADTLTVLVDGERLLDVGARHNLRSEVTMMLQALLDGGKLRPDLRLALVLTKLDTIRSAEHGERAQRDFTTLLLNLRSLFASALAEIEAFEVAASPKTDVVPRGTGVPELLAFWVKPSALSEPPSRERPRFRRTFARLRPVDDGEEAADG